MCTPESAFPIDRVGSSLHPHHFATRSVPDADLLRFAVHSTPASRFKFRASVSFVRSNSIIELI
jgi:hypothetical protein